MKFVARSLSLVLLSTSVVGSSLAFAGAADLSDADGSTMKFEYRGNKLRINMADDKDGYMILDENGLYVVRDADGQLMVIDAGKMMKMFAGMAGSATPSMTGSKVVSLKATGRMEEHGGAKGEVYQLKYQEEGSSKVQQAELVLSGDKRAIELSHAMSGMARSIAKSAGKSLQGANEFEKRLDKLNMGVLRYGNDLTVSAISGRKIDNARFVLPAEPQDLTSMSGLADFMNGANQSGGQSQASEKKSGGLVSGFLSALGGKKAPEDDKSTDEEEEEEEGSLTKTFGKLFGK